MKFVVWIVKPPFAVDINEFSLAFKEVSVVLGFPTHTSPIVSECPVGRIPIGDNTAVGAEGTEIHDRNGAFGVESSGVDGFVET